MGYFIMYIFVYIDKLIIACDVYFCDEEEKNAHWNFLPFFKVVCERFRYDSGRT